MTEKQFHIFIAAFYADEQKLLPLIELEADLHLPIPVENSDFFVGEKVFEFSVLDILQMTMDCWRYDFENGKEQSEYSQHINPTKIYLKAEAAFKAVSEKFPNFIYNDLEYNKHLYLVTCFGEYPYLDEEEMQENETEGYRKIDLELINYGYCFQAKKVAELLAQGANHLIDPLDKTSESLLLELMFHHFHDYKRELIHYLHYFAYDDSNYIDRLERKDVGWMLTYLYAIGGASKIYSLVVKHSATK